MGELGFSQQTLGLVASPGLVASLDALERQGYGGQSDGTTISVFVTFAFPDQFCLQGRKRMRNNNGSK